MSERPDRRRVLLADDYSGMLSALTRLLAPWCDVVGDDLVRAIQMTRSVTPAADA